MSAQLDNTADDDAVIDVPTRVVSVSLVPMETGLRAYESPEDRPTDLRILEARIAALRMLKEFPQVDTEDVRTVISRFNVDSDVEWPDEDDDSDEADDERERLYQSMPSRRLLEQVLRTAEAEYGRKHQGADWPEVAEEKQRIREEQAAANERNRRLADEAATMPRADAETAAETRDEEMQLSVHALESPRADVERKAPPPYVLALRDKLAEIGAPPSSRLVALALALYVNGKTHTARPGYATLAHDTGYSKSTIQLAMADLKERGVVKVVRKATPEHAASYRFIV